MAGLLRDTRRKNYTEMAIKPLGLIGGTRSGALQERRGGGPQPTPPAHSQFREPGGVPSRDGQKYSYRRRTIGATVVLYTRCGEPPAHWHSVHSGGPSARRPTGAPLLLFCIPAHNYSSAAGRRRLTVVLPTSGHAYTRCGDRHAYGRPYTSAAARPDWLRLSLR